MQIEQEENLNIINILLENSGRVSEINFIVECCNNNKDYFLIYDCDFFGSLLELPEFSQYERINYLQINSKITSDGKKWLTEFMKENQNE